MVQENAELVSVSIRPSGSNFPGVSPPGFFWSTDFIFLVFIFWFRPVFAQFRIFLWFGLVFFLSQGSMGEFGFSPLSSPRSLSLVLPV